MPETSDAKPSLAESTIWIIDDDIPIHLASFNYEDMLSGERPIDRGTLLTLLQNPAWDETPVKALCRQLAQEAKTVLAFTQPAAAVKYLREGGLAPDAIVYDLVYQNMPTGANALELLGHLLRQALAVVQVYTQESPEQASADLQGLMSKYHGRLASPQIKATTDSDMLARVIAAKLEASLAARLAKQIRRLSIVAVEEVLARVDDLPLDVAVRLLVAPTNVPEEIEFVDMLSIKVGEALEAESELHDAVSRYVVAKGFPADRISDVAAEIIALLVSHMRENIANDGGLYSELERVYQAHTAPTRPSAEQARVSEIIRDFFSFRLYAHPTDLMVRTGDIVVKTAKADDAPPDLFLVVTPACDLARFLKKTRGCLTLARMRPVQTQGALQARGYGNNDSFQVGTSITAQPPVFVLPSVPMPGNRRPDYVAFAHELEVMDVAGAELLNADRARANRPLTYSDLEGRITRTCRVSEPFLSGILAEIQSILFRLGIPDYPHEEMERLKLLFPKRTA